MNGTRDIVFKRCGCTDEATGRQLAGRCPRIADRGHGSWYYAVQVTTVGGAGSRPARPRPRRAVRSSTVPPIEPRPRRGR
jgi:hypothetical protein